MSTGARRRWTLDEKHRFVSESYSGARLVPVTARRNSIYSLRHYALCNGIGVFEVARDMGTSVRIIQEYYGKQATSVVFATRLGD